MILIELDNDFFWLISDQCQSGLILICDFLPLLSLSDVILISDIGPCRFAVKAEVFFFHCFFFYFLPQKLAQFDFWTENKTASVMNQAGSSYLCSAARLLNGPNSHRERFKREREKGEKKGVTLDCRPAETGCVTVSGLIKLEWFEPLKVTLAHLERRVVFFFFFLHACGRTAASWNLKNMFLFLQTMFFFSFPLIC